MLLCPRALVGILIPVVGLGVKGFFLDGGVAAGLALVAVSAYAFTHLSGSGGVGSARPSRIPVATLCADLVVAVAAFALLASTPTGSAAILLPFLGLEASLKLGRSILPLVAIGGLAALATRAGLRMAMFHLTPRTGLIATVVASTAVLSLLGVQLRTEMAKREHLAKAQVGIRQAFWATLYEELVLAGEKPDGERWQELWALFEQACVDPSVGSELANRVALLLRNGRGTWLSSRELEVMRLLSRGFSDREVARRLFISPATVRVHVANVVHKLGASNRSEALGLVASSRFGEDGAQSGLGSGEADVVGPKARASSRSVLNLGGLQDWLAIIEVARALKVLRPGEELEVEATDPQLLPCLARWANRLGHRSGALSRDEQGFHLLISRGASG